MKRKVENIKDTDTKKKRKKRRILLATVLVILLAIVLWSLFILRNILFGIPQPDTFYLAIYGGDPVIYYRGEGTKTMIWMMYMLGQMSLSMQNNEYYYLGDVVDLNDLSRSQPIRQPLTVDFRKLEDLHKLFIFDRYATFINVLENPDKSYIVFSFVGGPSDMTNYVYQVNLKTYKSKEIWQHEILTGNPPLSRGTAFVMQFVPDKYAVFDLVANNPPPAESPAGTVIVNMQTGKEKVLGPAGGVGDVHIDLDNDTVFYKLLGKANIPCEKPKDPICFPGDTYKFGYKPLGTTHLQSLP
jgi:hypothetical protein